MNATLENLARKAIKKGLEKLPENNHALFKMMYSPDDLDADINDVVDLMPCDTLDWAMVQVQNSIDKLNN